MADMSLDDLMSDKPFQEEQPPAQQVEAEGEAEAPKPETAEDIAEEPQPEPEGEPAAEKPEPQMVPLAALQEERQKSRSLGDRIAQIEQMLQQSSQGQKQAEPRKLPDMFEQPEAYTQAVMQMMAEREANLVAEMSERFARTQHGSDAVDAAFEAAKAAGTIDQFRGKKDPWGELVAWHKQHQVMSEIGNDPNAWREKERERMRQELIAEIAGQQQKQAAGRPAPSLAGQSNLGPRTKPAWSGPPSLDEILGG